MKTFFAKPFFKKYGRKALVVYVCWNIVKIIVILIVIGK